MDKTAIETQTVETLAVRWITEHKEEPSARASRRSHADPTADRAIGNIIREERWKKRRDRLRPNKWRAEGKPDERK